MPSFDLRDEPWISVRDGAVTREVSLRDVFARAHELRGLSGEIATQEIAVLRLLLVILHRALADDGRRDPIGRWEKLWAADRLPVERINAYLDLHGDRFDLFGAKPFMQVAGLTAAKTSGIAKMIADVPDGHQYFTTRAGRALDSLSYAEAARWLVHLQAFDPSGIKTGAVGDPRVKGGKGYPIGNGFAGWCGHVVLVGRDLRETLLLNLVLKHQEFDARADLPVWERDPQGAGVEDDHVEPTGICDLYTWQVRRVRLIRDGGVVVDALICNGDPVGPQNRQLIEPMTAWRYSEPQTKKLGRPTYMPQEHDPGRAFWRGLTATLADGSSANGPARFLRPEVIEWLGALTNAEILPAGQEVTLRAVGLVYGSNRSVVSAIMDDRLTLRAAVAADPSLRSLAVLAVEASELAVRQLADLGGNVARAAGAGKEAVPGAQDRARAVGFASLDGGYRSWLATLSADSDREARRASWQRYLVDTVLALGRQIVSDAGQAAYIGREGDRGFIDSSLAEAWFLAGLRKAIPGGWPAHPNEMSSARPASQEES